MFELKHLIGIQRVLLVSSILVLFGVGPAFSASDDPEPIGGALTDGPDPFIRSIAVDVIGDGPDPINGIVHLPTPVEAIDDPDPFDAGLGDDPDPIHPIMICFMDGELDCVYLSAPL